MSTQNSDPSSSDEFEQLRKNLPQYSPCTMPRSRSREENPFVKWQLGRFNRSGSLKLADMVAMAFSITRKHIICAFLTTIPSFFLYYLMVRSPRLILVVSIHSLAALLGISVSFSELSNEGSTSKFIDLLSLQGLAALAIQTARSLSLFLTFKSFIDRESTMLFFMLSSLIIHYATYFHPCFIFEGKDLGILTSISFALRISLKPSMPSQTFGVFLVCSVLKALGPFTLGFTESMGNLLRCMEFLAICGSGRSTDSAQNSV